MNPGSLLSGAFTVALQAAADKPGLPVTAESWGELWKLGGLGWIYTVNLVIWSGLFLYLLRLGKRLDTMETMEKGQ